MNTFLTLILLAFMAATVFALVRGIVIFLRASSARARGGELYIAGEKQNQMMVARIVFQALAIVTVVLILMMRR